MIARLESLEQARDRTPAVQEEFSLDRLAVDVGRLSLPLIHNTSSCPRGFHSEGLLGKEVDSLQSPHYFSLDQDLSVKCATGC